MNLNEPLPLVVIGGGAAGMIAAWRAGSLGAKVILLEKNSKARDQAPHLRRRQMQHHSRRRDRRTLQTIQIE